MHKTGTTSIQDTLAALRSGQGWRCVRTRTSGNMSVPLMWMFHSDPQSILLIQREGLPPDAIARYRHRARRRLDATLSSTSEQTVVISGEGILRVDAPGRADLAAFLRRHFSQIRVVAYIRPPSSYMSSAFQQRIKGGTTGTFDPEAGWARYRARLEDWDQHFGRENVSFWKYAPERFPGRCVVRDFTSRLGLPVPEEKILRSNDSLSLAGVSILYAYRKHGPAFGVGPAASGANTEIVRAAQTLAGPKFRFSSRVTGPICARHADDLAWMEERLGETLAETDGQAGTDVSDEADLLRMSSDDCEAFVAAFEERTGLAIRVRLPAVLDPKPEAVARVVETCREVYLRRPTTRVWCAARQVAMKLLR